jgi:hypothetical protein
MGWRDAFENPLNLHSRIRHSEPSILPSEASFESSEGHFRQSKTSHSPEAEPDVRVQHPVSLPDFIGHVIHIGTDHGVLLNEHVIRHELDPDGIRDLQTTTREVRQVGPLPSPCA